MGVVASQVVSAKSSRVCGSAVAHAVAPAIVTPPPGRSTAATHRLRRLRRLPLNSAAQPAAQCVSQAEVENTRLSLCLCMSIF
jgi:hypothetical protein